jgi:hypothetical protein
MLTNPSYIHTQGLEWVAKNKKDPAIVHMSIEGSYNTAINDAVEKLINNYKVHVIVSAGKCRRSTAKAAEQAGHWLTVCYQ